MSASISLPVQLIASHAQHACPGTGTCGTVIAQARLVAAEVGQRAHQLAMEAAGLENDLFGNDIGDYRGVENATAEEVAAFDDTQRQMYERAKQLRFRSRPMERQAQALKASAEQVEAKYIELIAAIEKDVGLQALLSSLTAQTNAINEP